MQNPKTISIRHSSLDLRKSRKTNLHELVSDADDQAKVFVQFERKCAGHLASHPLAALEEVLAHNLQSRMVETSG